MPGMGGMTKGMPPGMPPGMMKKGRRWVFYDFSIKH
jgi:hypothetical protein